MKHIHIIGIGTGNPEHVTIQAIKAMNAADVIFLPLKGAAKDELADVRREICQRYINRPGIRISEFEVPQRQTAERSYAQSVDAWHGEIADIYGELITGLPENASGAFLVWGDPSLYDSTIRIIERVRQQADRDFDYSVVPGITSIQALAASHKIPVNLVGKPIEITTGRGWRGRGSRRPRRSSCSTANRLLRKSTIPMPRFSGAPISAPKMRSSDQGGSAMSRPRS